MFENDDKPYQGLVKVELFPKSREPDLYDNVPSPLPKQGERGFRANKGPNPLNTSGFSATGHRLLLVGEAVEEVTAGGIILQRKTVDAEKSLAVMATVVEIGHDAWADKSTDYCQVGDKVLVGQYAGKFHTSPLDGKEYRFLNDLDVITPVKG